MEISFLDLLQEIHQFVDADVNLYNYVLHSMLTNPEGRKARTRIKNDDDLRAVLEGPDAPQIYVTLIQRNPGASACSVSTNPLSLQAGGSIGNQQGFMHLVESQHPNGYPLPGVGYFQQGVE